MSPQTARAARCFAGAPVLGLLALTSAPAVAQSHFIRVSVVDSSGVPARGANVSIVRGLNTVIASMTADSTGRATTIIRDNGDFHAVVRRLGFRPADQFFPVGSMDSIVDVNVVVFRAPVVLEAVRVVADSDLKRRRMFIDADAIANSSRLILDGMDIVT